VVSSPLQPPYSRAKMVQYTLNGRPGGPQSWATHFRHENNFLPLLGIEPQFLSSTAYSLDTIPTSLS